MIQRQRGDRQHADTLFADEKGKLIGAVQCSAIFHHAQMPGGDLVVDPVVEHDDAVGDIFLQAVAREGLAPALGGDDGGYTLVLEPAEEPAQFAAQNGLVG